MYYPNRAVIYKGVFLELMKESEHYSGTLHYITVEHYIFILMMDFTTCGVSYILQVYKFRLQN